MNNQSYLPQYLLALALVSAFFISFAAVSASFHNVEFTEQKKQPSQQAILLNESFVHKGALSKVLDNEPVLDNKISQLVVVVVEDDQAISGELFTFEKHSEPNIKKPSWSPYTISTQVVVGKNGIAWGKGLQPKQQGNYKKEGDGKAPSGVFALGSAFGYLPSINTHLAYTQMSANDYCIDVNGSPYYNQIVSKAIVGKGGIKGSSEPMRRDIHLKDQLYKKGIVIAHNSENASGDGSCIFMHVWRDQDKPTAGCTAMSEKALDQLLHWLDKDKKPAFVLLSKVQYQRVQERWQLPKIDFSVATQ